MFDKLKGFVKEAAEVRAQVKSIQDELKSIKVEGTDKKKRFSVTITGDLECTEVKLPDDISAGDTKGLVQAINKALNEAKDLASKKLSAVSKNLKLPGAE